MNSNNYLLSCLTEQDENRFWNKVKKAGDDECWQWMGSKSHQYSKQLNRPQRGVFQKYDKLRHGPSNLVAYRVAFYLTHGKTITNGAIICHHCDNPMCCNPKHLFEGSFHDNTQDMMTKGRNTKRQGELNTQVKLKPKQVLEIRELCRLGGNHRLVAEKYGVTRMTVTDIWNRHSWKHL